MSRGLLVVVQRVYGGAMAKHTKHRMAMARAIEDIVRGTGDNGIKFDKIILEIKERWPNQQLITERSVHRHLAANKRISYTLKANGTINRKVPDYRLYTWEDVKEEGSKPWRMHTQEELLQMPTEFMLPLDEDEMEALSEEGVVWRPIEGFPDYEIGSNGQLMSWRHTVEGKVQDPPSGRTQILDPEGVPRHVRLHTLVAEAFMVPRPENHVLVYEDGDQSNRSVSNLRWELNRDFALSKFQERIEEQRNKENCFRGHPLSGDNLYESLTNGRTCVMCRKARQVATMRRARQRAAGQEPTWSTEDVLLERGQLSFDRALELL